MKQSLGPLQTKWVEALESGNYAQIRAVLCKQDKNEKLSYCCLGVACEIVGIKKENSSHGIVFEGERFGLPDSIISEMKFRSNSGKIKNLKLRNENDLAKANDFGATFKEIAAFVRANPEAVFTEEA